MGHGAADFRDMMKAGLFRMTRLDSGPEGRHGCALGSVGLKAHAPSGAGAKARIFLEPLRPG